MIERRQPRKRIYSHITRSRFLHLEDTLDIGKIRLYAGEYTKGQGARATVYHFLDLDDARVLLADLSWGKKAEFTDYKGTTNGDGPQSRVLKVNSKGDKVWLEIQNGPGEVVGEGAIKPKGKPTAAVSIPLTVWEARKLAHAALAYIHAWESKHLLDFVPVAPVGNNIVPAAPEVFNSPGEAIDWGFEAGAFKVRKDARDAYDKLKAEQKPAAAREMARLWVADVRRRLAAAVVE
jgi:hypothetical protein